MKLGIIGLGKMGFAIVDRVLKAGHEVVAFDLSQEQMQKICDLGATAAPSIKELSEITSIIWIMVPEGKPVDDVLAQLTLKPEMIIIDGGNSNFKDSMRRAEQLKKQNVRFLDCGTSGGLHGHDLGFSLMIGGDHESFLKAESIFKAVAALEAYAYLGASGAGHYIKMVHNGIEYALLEAYAEGFNLLKNGSFKDLDLAKVAGVWEHGSIIRSWICTLSRQILEQDQELESISGGIGEKGTGRWTVEEAEAQNIPVDVIKQSLDIRAWSRTSGGDWRTKMVNKLRNQFGGHEVSKGVSEK